MREWFVKHEKAITIVIVALLVVGMIWWSVGTYMSTRNTSAANNQYSKDQAAVVLTKDGEELDYPYWIMKDTLKNEYKIKADQYTQYYGQQVDPVYDSISLKLSIVNQLFDLNVVTYYGEQNKLLPSEKTVKNELNAQIDEYMKQLKAQSNWDQLSSYYGGESKVRELIYNNSYDSVKSSLIYSNVQNNVSPVSKDEAVKYINDNLSDLKDKYEEVNAQHILFSDQATALEVKKMIEDGKISFADAAAEYSQDTSNATNSGNLGWFKRADMVEEFSDAAFTLDKNVLSDVISSSYGYHLINVLDKKIFNSAEDFLADTDVYKEIESTIATDKFNKWLEAYKTDENFGKKYYAEYLEISTELTAAGTDISEVKKVYAELEPKVFDDTDEVILDVDSALLAEYNIAVSTILTDENNYLLNLKKYISLEDSVDSNLISKDLDVLNAELTKVSTDLTKDGADTETLTTKKLALEDAIDFITVKTLLNEKGLNDVSQITAERDSVQAEYDSLMAKNKKVLKELFYQYPSSAQVVSKYYSVNPEDLDAKVAYSKIQLNQIKQYVSYLGADAVKMYLNNNIREIVLNISSVINSSKAGDQTKLDALDLGIDLSNSLNDMDLKLTYLELIKEIDPGYYSDIDNLIEETKASIDSTSDSTGN